MKRYVCGALIILSVPLVFFAQQKAQRLFVWDNDRGKSTQDNPAVGLVHEALGYAVWNDARWGDYDIYGQAFNTERGLVGSNFPISIDEYNEFQQFHADIACSPMNFYISVWEESLYRPSPKPSKIYAMICEKEPFVVYQHEMSQKYPSVSCRYEGWFAISWTSYTGGTEPSILCRIYDEGGGPVAMNTVCEKVQIPDTVPLSSVAYCDKGGLVVYEDWRGDGTECSIFGTYFKPDGSIVDREFKVSYYGGGSEKDERDPDVATNEAGYMVAVWVDNHEGVDRIYGQRIIAEEGAYYFYQEPFPVYPEGGEQKNPRVAMFEHTGGDFSFFIVVWEQDMGSHWNVRGLVFKDLGYFQPFDIPVQNTGNQKQPYASARWGDIVSIVWSCSYNNRYYPDVYLRNFKRDNTETGLIALGSYDIPLVPMDPDTGVGGRKCWYFDDENYDNPDTPDWNEDPIPEGPPRYVDLEYAIVDQLMELNTNNQYIIECEDTLPFKQGKALTDYDAIFLDLGYRTLGASAGTMTQLERNELSNYVKNIASGGPLMVDGNDFGYMYDTTDLFSCFFAKYQGDGAAYTTGNIDTLLGKTPKVFTEGMALPYCYQSLPDNYPDSIRPIERFGKLLLETTSLTEWYAGYSIGSCMSWFGDERDQYSTIYNSFIPSAITGTIHPNTYSEFYRRCLGHMGLAVQPEPIVDLFADDTSAGLSEGEVNLIWTIVCDDSLNDPVNSGYRLKFSRAKMTSEAAYDAAEEYYQAWDTPGAVDDTARQTLSGLPPMDTLIFALKVHDEDGLYNALGAEPRAVVVGDAETPHNLVIGENYVKDFSNKYEFLHAHPLATEDDSLFVTWDSDTFYIGFARFDFESGGDLLLYFDIMSGQGADSTYPYNGTSGCSHFNASPYEFRPDYCIIMERSTSLRLFQCTGKGGRDTWTQVVSHGINHCVDNVVNDYLYTEIGVPFDDLGYNTANPFKLVATVQNETNNTLIRIYPPYNPVGSGVIISQYYYWSCLGSGMIPKTTAQIIGIAEEHSLPGPEMFGKPLLAVPNPFRNTIDLFLNQSFVSSCEQSALRIFDVTGRLVRNFDLAQYRYRQISKITWDGKDERGAQVARGIYFCELVADEQAAMEKIIFIR